MRTNLITLITVFFSIVSFAQKGVRVGYIDMDYILTNVPEYVEANKQLEKKVAGWHQEIELKKKEIEEMQEALNSERVLLTKELIEEREEDILYKEKEVLDFQQQCFGPTGYLVNQKQILIQPIQDQVFNAVQQIAVNKKFDYVFDKAADAVMLYTADRFDISDLVIRSITRAAKRTQLNSKSDKKNLESEEDEALGLTREELERKQAIEAKKAEREALIAKRNAQRDSIRKARIAEYEAKKQALLAQRQRIKDSIAALKQN